MADNFASVDRPFLSDIISLMSLKIALALLFITYFLQNEIMFLLWKSGLAKAGPAGSVPTPLRFLIHEDL